MKFVSSLKKQLAILKSPESKCCAVHQFMQDQTILNECTHHLSSYIQHPTAKQTKIVLIAVVLTIYPEALIPHEDPMHTQLTKHASVVFNRLNTKQSTEQQTQTFQDTYSLFEHAFNIWKNKDKEYLLHTLARSYINIDDASRVVHIPRVEHIKHKLRTQVNMLHLHESTFEACVHAVRASDMAHRAVHEIRTKINALNINDDTEAQQNNPQSHHPSKAVLPDDDTITSIVQRAFWDAFVYRLQEGHTDQLELLLTELSNKLKQLTPSRHDIHQNIHTALDIKLIVQMVKHQCMDNTHFLKTTDFIVQHVIHMQAPVHNETTKAWYESWKTTFVSIDNTNNTSFYARQLAEYLKHIHHDIDTILSFSF